MNFYLNEYSLDGQFEDEKAFIDSLSETTLPVFKELKELFHNDCLIYKSQSLWERPICTSLILYDVLKKSPRIPELRKTKELLHELCNSNPFFSNCEEIKNVQYYFNKDNVPKYDNPNCFVLAAINEEDLFSFENDDYKIKDLEIEINNKVYNLQNIFNKESFEDYRTRYKFGSDSPSTSWKVKEFRVEIRPKENNCNTPHVHIVSKEYDISYSLENGNVLERKPQDATDTDAVRHRKIIQNMKDNLVDTWNYYHPDRLVKQF